MQNSLPIKNKLSKINLNCKQIENGKQKTCIYKYNFVVSSCIPLLYRRIDSNKSSLSSS